MTDVIISNGQNEKFAKTNKMVKLNGTNGVNGNNGTTKRAEEAKPNKMNEDPALYNAANQFQRLDAFNLIDRLAADYQGR